MGYEVEVKYQVDDPEALARRLAELGASSDPEVEHADAYLAHPARDFRLSGEAFRIRTEGDQNALTYKGPKQGGATKTREEIEVAFQSGRTAHHEMIALLDRLGFVPVATVRKRRTSFHLTMAGRDLAVVIDRAGALGDFAEVETLVTAPEQLPEAQAAVLALAEKLQLVAVEPRSYLRMLLERMGSDVGNLPGQT